MTIMLGMEQLQAFCQGAVRVFETDGAVRFSRFTEEQEQICRNLTIRKEQVDASAGMKLCFETDALALSLKVKVAPATVRQFFSVDLKVDNIWVGSLDNFSQVKLPQNYVDVQLSMGEVSGRVLLEKGRKTVSIYLPWSVAAEIGELSLENASFVKAVRPSKRLLVFGDSISQGYDVLRPSNHYGIRLAESIGAELVNKGMGGACYFPALAASPDEFVPDKIVVAYGTNDWLSYSEAEFRDNCEAFYRNLRMNYPQTHIYAIGPIWRRDCGEEKGFGDFELVGGIVEEIVSWIPGITYICGMDLVPHEECYYADLRLHPNDSGFDHYARKLCGKIS